MELWSMAPYASKAKTNAFQSFQAWLKREPFHRRGQYCPDADCPQCTAWRLIEDTRKSLRDAVAVRQEDHSEPAGDAQSHPTLPYHRLGGSAEMCVGIPCSYQYLSGQPCCIGACEEVGRACDGFRNFCHEHVARPKAYWRNVRQVQGQVAGHQIAVDALVALASAPYPVSLIDGVVTAEETREAKKDFDHAARRELWKTIQESIDAS